MAPPKNVDGGVKMPQIKPNVAAKVSTRLSSRTSATANMLKKMNLKDQTKRKADQLSPPKGKTTKRSAFYDITNAASAANSLLLQKKTSVFKKEIVKVAVTAQPKVPVLTRIGKTSVRSKACNQENIDPLAKSKQTLTTIKEKDVDVKKKEAENVLKVDTKGKESKLKLRTLDAKPKDAAVAKKDSEKKAANVTVLKIKEIAQEEVKTVESFKSATSGRKSLTDESSLYASALENIDSIAQDESLLIITPIKKEKPKCRTPGPPHGIHDFDKENIEDPSQVSTYAMDVFKYLKAREEDYAVSDYMAKQGLINKWMRSLLVDWMVDVQEHFELNHETLYLAVKLMDIYLDKKTIAKESLQLLGAASLYISSKYDERIPPSIDEVLYVCENVYTRKELIEMEIKLFKTVDYCLGMPISYRFLRRFARCCKTSMAVLTLARYILELSLMEYTFVFTSESKLACAALYLALKMKEISGWTQTLEYYSSYKLTDFYPIVVQLNAMLHRKPKDQLKTVRNKYSHSVFFEVAKTPLLDTEKL